MKKICFSILLLPVVFLAEGVLLFWVGFSQNQAYNSAESVTAIVAESCYETWDTDGTFQSGYNIYVDYTFNNKTYSHIYWKTQDDSMALGEQVTIKIHSDTPDQPLSNNMFFLMILAVPVGIAGLVMAFLLFPHSVETVEPGEQAHEIGSLFWLVFLIPAVVFLILGFTIGPLFHIGTIIFAYFTVVMFEVL